MINDDNDSRVEDIDFSYQEYSQIMDDLGYWELQRLYAQDKDRDL